LAPVDYERWILFDVTRIDTTTRADINSCRISLGLCQRVQLYAICVAGKLVIKLEAVFFVHARFRDLGSEVFCVGCGFPKSIVVL